jgi:Tfp pilus assembly protein PilN
VLEQAAKTLSTEWPTLLVTGILIPILQWLATLVWNMRTRYRIAAIRKEIVEVDAFIAHFPEPLSDPSILQALQNARKQRVRLFDQLNRTLEPLSARSRKVLRITLLTTPRYAISWFFRIVYYICLLMFFFIGVVLAMQNPQDADEININVFLASAADVAVAYLLCRAVDGVSGAHPSRPVWRRYTLIYRPVRWYLYVVHAIYWLFVLMLVATLANPKDLDMQDLYITLPLTFGMTGLVLWLARHLDRNLTLHPTPARPTLPTP